MLQTTSLRGQVEQLLRAEILERRLTPGQQIDVAGLAKRWGISITPVRDAVQRLETEGLVTVRPRKGVYVASLGLADVRQIYDVRRALECLAVESAIDVVPVSELHDAERTYSEAGDQLTRTGDREALIACDRLVHDLVLRHCGNPRLVQTMNGIADQVRWARSMVTDDPTTYELALAEHLAVLGALAARDTDAAVAAMREHLTNSAARVQVAWRETDAS
jgi:DNA-binding GntR family transcriptional regulator